MPAIIDPNTNITLWESGAIIEYLSDTYDKEHKLTPTTVPEKYQVKQFLHLQTSGQGPYFGNAVWFTVFHSEQLPSAQLRFKNEIRRVTKVLDGCLEGKEYLVGDKCSYADLAFVPWYLVIPMLEEGALSKELEAANPNFAKWLHRLKARPAVAKIIQDRQTAMAAK